MAWNLFPRKWAEQKASRATALGLERTRAACCHPDRPYQNNPMQRNRSRIGCTPGRPGTFLLTSGADTTVHQLDAGLFGAVNVQPQGAEWYRSQTTRCEMQAATLDKRATSERQEQKLGDYQPPTKARG